MGDTLTTYTYLADGTKLRKTYGTKTTEYQGAFQYEGSATAPLLQFSKTAEGYYDFVKNAYIYQYVDHLGNIRVSYYKNSAGVLTLLEENNYYPFGLKHKGYNSTSSATTSYQYKYNGKELQETGMYDYGARFYMPDIGRWGVVDPLAEKYVGWSPYVYVMNNPINAIDPDGRRVYFVAGAGNDSDGWNYASRFKSIWTSLGIKDFKRVNANHGKMGDIGFVNNYRNKQSYWTQGEFSAPNQHFATSDKQYQQALKGIINDLSKNPLKDGEQLNLTGYSYGAVLQEHLAIGLADKGYKIDNLILIGSPTSDGSDLMTKLQEYQEAG
ncbi:RHS repeat-associated core domain-containing protein [Chryseobacterium sp. A321]